MDLVKTIALALLILVEGSCSFTIGAFNIQIFGEKKAENVEVMENIVKILQRYDIVLIQEIRDRWETSIELLHFELNKASNDMYDKIVSERLGTGQVKEQYAFFYRDSDISVVSEYVYNGTNNIFERPPYIAKFRAENTVISEFVLVGIHAKPAKAIEEISALEIVTYDIISEMKTDDILILGDLNADCKYAPKYKLDLTQIGRKQEFHWLISSGTKTAVATDCAYDRFIVYGEKLRSTILEGSNGVFYFDKEYGLSNEQTKDISDHYPIELQLKTIQKDPLRTEL